MLQIKSSTEQEYIFLVNQVSELNLKDQKQLEPLWVTCVWFRLLEYVYSWR